MKHLNIFLSFVLSIALFTSCDQMTGLLAASSAANEVFVIMENNAWQEESGRAVHGSLTSRTRGLPRPEANFRVIQIEPEHFTRSFRSARNVVIPQISNIFSAPALRANLDVYAMGQVIMYINAPDTATFVQFVNDHRQVIVDYFIQKELERNAMWLMNSSRTGAMTRARERFGIDIFPPRGLPNVLVDTDNFLWVSNNAPRGRQDMVIYQFPYVTADIFNVDSLVAIRNQILGENIPGAFNSQMSTEVVHYPPHFREMIINGLYRAEVRGLWEMTNDMMGGPFVMHALVNENTGMVVVVEMFVFSPEPQTSTRNLMRNMEASLYTISLTEQSN